jgi:hypothetical protein
MQKDPRPVALLGGQRDEVVAGSERSQLRLGPLRVLQVPGGAWAAIHSLAAAEALRAGRKRRAPGARLCRREGIKRKDAGEVSHARGRRSHQRNGQIWRRSGVVMSAFGRYLRG